MDDRTERDAERPGDQERRWDRPARGWTRRDEDATVEVRSGGGASTRTVGDPAGGDEQARPAAPLPPPATWSAYDDGPGSPAGSIRPPDTTGTVDAPRRSGGARRGVAGTLLGALVGAVIGTAGTLALARSAPGVMPDVRAPVVEAQGGGQPSVVEAVADAVIPSVVRIDRLIVNGGVPEEQGLGSGVIYRSDGYILTNNHVVEGADRLQVKMANGVSSEARIVGADPLTDVAVLKVDATELPAINVRDGSPSVGELAVAIGSPFGLDATVTAGVVSAVNRSISVEVEEGLVSIPNVVQTDAAINPGNSGGALVDGEGRLVGINTAIPNTGSGLTQAGNVGIGFAISAQEAVAIADKLIEQGFVRHARLGIQGGDLTPSVAREYDIDVTEGVLVAEVEPDGPADEAGLREGDVIVEAAGDPIRTMDELVRQIRQREPGDALELTIVRDGERTTVEAVLGEWRQ